MTHRDMLNKWLNPSNTLLGQSAVLFCESLFRISHIWDDLKDEGKVDSRLVDAAFFEALVELPRNAFYVSNFQFLHPLITNAIFDWQISNRLEADGDEQALRISYVLRDTISGIVTFCAYLLSGVEYAMSVGVEVRRYVHDEVFEVYKASLKKENV
jgi:hypothetical protein